MIFSLKVLSTEYVDNGTTFPAKISAFEITAPAFREFFFTFAYWSEGLNFHS
jgi:hypothetical protein